MALQRRKVTVRTKRGKVYQRSMMVQAQAIGRRASKSGKLHALNPWEQRHTEHVKTGGPEQPMGKFSGSSGPGSDHSWIALLVGHGKQRSTVHREAGPNTPDHRAHSTLLPMVGESDVFTSKHAAIRRQIGERGVDSSSRFHRASTERLLNPTTDYGHNELGRSHYQRNDLIERYGRENIHEVHQDPRKWVR